MRGNFEKADFQEIPEDQAEEIASEPANAEFSEAKEGETVPSMPIVFFDLPFHSDPHLRNASHEDFERKQEIPRGALSVATHLARRGFDSRVVPMDALLNPKMAQLDEEQQTEKFAEIMLATVKEKIDKYKPKVIGISYMFSPTQATLLKLTDYLKENYPDLIIVVGGNAATFERQAVENGQNTKAILLDPDQGSVDIVVDYEAEQTMSQLLKKLDENEYDLLKLDLASVAGISYWEQGDLVRTGRRERNQYLDEGENAGGLDYDKIEEFENLDLRDFNNYTMFSRGCLGCCQFCTSPAFWGRTVTHIGLESFKHELMTVADRVSSYSESLDRSSDSEDVKNQEKQIGLLDDDIFLELSFHEGKVISGKEKTDLIAAGREAEIETKTIFDILEPVLQEIKDKYSDVKYMVQTRYAHFREEEPAKIYENGPSEEEINYASLLENSLIKQNDEYLRHIKELGVERVYLGMESANQPVLNTIRKNTFIDWLIPVCQKIKNAGLKVGLFWIIGLPGATEKAEDETMEIIKFLTENNLVDEFEPHIFVPLPGSAGAASNRIKRIEGRDAAKESYISGEPVHQCVDENGQVTLTADQMKKYYTEANSLSRNI